MVLFLLPNFTEVLNLSSKQVYAGLELLDLALVYFFLCLPLIRFILSVSFQPVEFSLKLSVLSPCIRFLIILFDPFLIALRVLTLLQMLNDIFLLPVLPFRDLQMPLTVL